MAPRTGPQLFGDSKKRKATASKKPALPGSFLPTSKLKSWATGPQLKAIGKKVKSIVPGKKK